MVEIGELLYKPSFGMEEVTIFGATYLKSVKDPNIFVFDSINTRESNISFTKESVLYELNGCSYSEIEGNTHVNCLDFSMTYIDPKH